MSDLADPRLSSVAESGEATLVRLPWWRRFDIKVAALVGLTTLMIVVVTGIFAYNSIIGAEGSGQHARLQVNFEDAGAKWLVLAYANLVVLG